MGTNRISNSSGRSLPHRYKNHNEDSGSNFLFKKTLHSAANSSCGQKAKNIHSAEIPSPLPREGEWATLSLKAPSSSAFLLVYEQLDPTVGIELSHYVSILDSTRVSRGST